MTPCPLCQSREQHVYLQARDHASGDRFTLMKCRVCECVFLSPVPADLGRYYHASYRRYNRPTQRLFAMLYRMRGHHWARSMGTPGRALEIGCGEGWMLAALKEVGWKVVGTERTAETAQFAAKQQGLPMVVATLEAFRPEPLFDLIIMHHVLEHLPNPMTILAQCSALLRPGGTLVLAVPNLQSWQFSVSGKNWFHLDVPRHLTDFTPSTISQAINRAGLKLHAIRFMSWDQDPFGWMVSILNVLGFPQTRWLHWLANKERQPTLVNFLMMILSPPLLALGFVLAPLSWIFGRGACMEVRARKSCGNSIVPNTQDLRPSFFGNSGCRGWDVLVVIADQFPQSPERQQR